MIILLQSLKKKMQKKKVLVGLSGGVDSAVTAYLLKKEGYEVSAGFMVNYYTADDENCTTKKDLEVAKEVAEYLKIPFFTFDYVKEYDDIILKYIYEWYQKWLTPNPDVFCNSEVKFKLFLDEAMEAGFDYIATGHYARIIKTSSPALLLKEKGEVWIRENYFETPDYVKTLARDLRKKQTDSEDILWEILRNRNFEWLKFRRQSPFGRYIADFYCSEAKLVIELDGKIHESQKEYDMIRDEIISKYGVTILRIKNEEIFNTFEWVLEKIRSFIPLSLRRGARGEVFHLLKGVDNTKDQSYFLSFLNQYQLSKSLFPIGHLQKSEVRKIAEEAGLPNAMRKDSQGLCFVGKVDFKAFLEKKIPHKTGDIVDMSGKKLGEHDGVFFYTIGQRKWLRVGGLEKPIFVVDKNVEKNQLIVTDDESIDLTKKELICRELHFVGKEPLFPFTGKAKIRYRQQDQECIVDILTPTPLNEEGCWAEAEQSSKTQEDTSLSSKERDWGWGFYIFTFKEPQRAITSGQVATLYDGEELVASGIII